MEVKSTTVQLTTEFDKNTMVLEIVGKSLLELWSMNKDPLQTTQHFLGVVSFRVDLVQREIETYPGEWY